MRTPPQPPSSRPGGSVPGKLTRFLRREGDGVLGLNSYLHGCGSRFWPSFPEVPTHPSFAQHWNAARPLPGLLPSLRNLHPVQQTKTSLKPSSWSWSPSPDANGSAPSSRTLPQPAMKCNDPFSLSLLYTCLMPGPECQGDNPLSLRVEKSSVSNPA